MLSLLAGHSSPLRAASLPTHSFYWELEKHVILAQLFPKLGKEAALEHPVLISGKDTTLECRVPSSV